jgi:hypothetical protein
MKKSLITLMGLFYTTIMVSEYSKVITTGVPFLMVAADTFSGYGESKGVTTSANAFSQQYNPAKYAFG